MATQTITSALDALRAGELTSVELVRQSIDVAEALDDATGMYVTRFDGAALAAAEAADQARVDGASLGPLHGIPIGIKDIITTAEGQTTAQSAVHDRDVLSGDAVVVQRLRDAGAIITGKLSTSEFAIGAPDDWAGFAVPRNPWDLAHSPGGSSAGSGIAVAAGGVLGALGTDTGGSIRIPAAYNGITGLMPTFGRVPKSGCVPLGFSLDHIGPMARSAADCALMLSVMAGFDASDATALDVPVDDYSSALTGDLTGVRIGVDRLHRFSGAAEDSGLAEAFTSAIDVLRSRGAQTVELEVPFYREVSVASWLIMLAEAAAYHMPDLQTQLEMYGTQTRKMLLQGLLYSATDYVQAQRARRAGARALREAYQDVDVIITPTAAGAAPSIEGLLETAASGAEEFFHSIFTPYWDGTGNPVMSLPMGFSDDGLPFGLQISGRPFEEAQVLKVGDAYQQDTDWHLQVPQSALRSVA